MAYRLGAMNYMIELEAVSYAHRLGAEPFIHDLSWSVPAGQWVTLVGANGSGKSTLVKLLNGLLRISDGLILIDGIELQQETVGFIREKIGFVFQNPDNQFVGLTVAEDILFGLENRSVSRQLMEARLHDYAGLLQISDLLDRHPSELSGGQKQRVAIAGVLAVEPKIIVFDEATSMLDERAKRELLELMKQMRASGEYTLISVTHDEEEMLASDRMVVLSEGQIIADGPPEQVFTLTDVLARSRLKVPFTLQLARELQKLGIELGEIVHDRKLVDALWKAYNSKG